jgi:transposase
MGVEGGVTHQLVYASRQIAKAMRENINYIWLGGGQQPDFQTLNARSGILISNLQKSGSILEIFIKQEKCV